jgi:hypothetical protein
LSSERSERVETGTVGGLGFDSGSFLARLNRQRSLRDLLNQRWSHQDPPIGCET